MKNKIIIIVFFCLNLFNYSYAQTVNWAFSTGNTGDDGNFLHIPYVSKDNSGNVYNGGEFESAVLDVDPSATAVNLTNSGGRDGYVAKYSSAGALIWAVKIGGSNNDGVMNVATDNSGNVYVTGYFNSTIDFDPSAATYNLTATSTSGQLTGTVFLAKYNSTGQFQWALSFGGGTGFDYGWGLAVSPGGSVYLGGIVTMTGNMDVDPSPTVFNLSSANGNAFCVKYNTNGQLVNAFNIGAAFQNSAIRDIKLDNNGSVYIGGYIKGNCDIDPSAGVNTITSNSEDPFIMKMDTSFNFYWGFNIRTNSVTDEGFAISFDQNNVYLTGYVKGSNIDFDPSASSTSLSSAGGSDNFIASYTKSGQYRWAHVIGGTGEEWSLGSAQQASSIVICGYFSNTVDFDPSATTSYNLTSNGGKDGFCLKLDTNGIFKCAFNVGGTGDDHIHSAWYYGLDKLMINGTFHNTAHIPEPSGTTLVSNGGYDIFLSDINWDCYSTPCSGEPVAGTASGPSNVCDLQSFNISLSGYSQAANIAIQWQSSPAGTGNWAAIAGAISPVYTVSGGISAATDFRAIVTCTNTGNFVISNTVSVSVTTTPTPTINPGGAVSICPGSTINLSASPGVSYLWNTGATTQTVNISAAGSYWVNVTVASGCAKTTAATTVTVKNLPNTINITKLTPGTVCAPNTVLFGITNSPSAVSGFTYQWNLNGNPISGATGSVYEAAATGAYSLSVSGGTSCSKTSDPKTATIKPLPVASFTTVGSTVFCDGDSVILNANVQPLCTYKWLLNGASAGIGSSKTARLGGDYVLVANLDGCRDTSAPSTITVHPIPASMCSTTDPTTFCSGGSALLQASPSGAGYTYQWLMGSANITGANSSTYVAVVKAKYSVLITSVYGCSKISPMLKITVEPTPSATITPLGPTTISATGNVKLRASSGAGYVWQWYRNASLISGATARDYIATQGGDYTVFITKGNCSATSAPITVTQTGAKESNGVTSAAMQDGFELIAFPNPASNEVTVGIKGVETVDGTLQLVDISGRLVLTKTVNTNSATIDMRGLPSGNYIIRYKDNERTGFIKLVKE